MPKTCNIWINLNRQTLKMLLLFNLLQITFIEIIKFEIA